MSKHLKIVLAKTFAFTILIGLWNYWISGNYTESIRNLNSIIVQSLGTGVLFGIGIYYFDKPKKSA